MGDVSFGIELSAVGGGSNTANLIYNNVIYHVAGIGIRHYVYGTNNKIYNNIIYYNSDYETSPADAMVVVDNTWNSGTLYKTNLILFRDWSTLADVPGKVTIALNYTGTYYSVANANTNWSTYFQGNITSNPSFLNETLREFHIVSTSAAKDAGTSLTDTTWGTLAFNGAAPDIGAFEYY